MNWWRLSLLNWLFVIILLGAGIIVMTHAYRNGIKAPNPESDQLVTLRITPGMSAGQVAKVLKEHSLIRSRLAFRWYVYRHGLSLRLQAGLYRLHDGLDVPAIAARLSSGETAAVSVTINSGWRLDQIQSALLRQGFNREEVDRALIASYPHSILKDKPLSASLEGYLFPDTYRIEIDQPLEALIDLMLANTDEKATAEIRAGWAAQGLNYHEALTLGSIVQKEVSDPEDQRQVAQVFLKRLDLGIKLEADPTFEYASRLAGVEPSLSIDSPYNTYLYIGLPPTPISNMEVTVFEAVASPASTEWLYFLSDREGRTHFTTTEAEHKRNIEQYLR